MHQPLLLDGGGGRGWELLVTLHGCIPILVTPFLEDESLDLASLTREVEWLLGEGASGVAALAIASEGYKLTEGERDAIVERVVTTVDGRAPVVASADGGGAWVAVDRARRAVERGADAIMALPPSFMKPDGAGLREYYLRLADAVAVPIIVQDAPQLTGVAMSPALWAELHAAAPSIRYVKVEGTPQGAAISETVRQSGGKIGVFCGWGGLGLFDALERGAVGSMPAPNFTRVFAEAQQAYETHDYVRAETAFHQQLPFILWTMQSVDHSVATAKAALVQAGVLAHAKQRSPALTFDQTTAGQLRGWLRRSAGETP